MRTEVQKFAELMERKLQKREAKYPNGWKKDTAIGLFRHLKEEVDELQTRLVMHSNNDVIASEAIDVANMAMMIVDVLGQMSAD